MAGRILIVDDVAINRIVLRVKLGAAFYTPSVAQDGGSALAALGSDRPDVLLLDLDLPDMTGIEVLTRIRADRALRDLPVVMITASRDPADRLAALRAGADDILSKPVDDQLLLARLRSLMRRQAERPILPESPPWQLAEPPAAYDPPARVAVVTRRTELRLRLARDLARLTGHHVTAHSREDVLADSALPVPEVFVLDEDATDLHFLSEIRSRRASSHSGLMLICDGPRQAAMAFDLGADEVVPSSAEAEELALRLAALIRRTRAAETRRNSLNDSLRLAMTDPLTGLFNRRYALSELDRIAQTARIEGQPFAVLLIDLDRFKSVNDRFGHATGDLVLTQVAHRLSAAIRPGDLLARIGGEEFLLALPGLNEENAHGVAQDLCQAIAGTPIATPEGEGLTVTISIGIAMADRPNPARAAEGEDSLGRLIDRADRAMLAAKSMGRNRVASDRRAA